MESPSELPKISQALTKTLAVFGLIAVLGLISFGIIKVAPSVIRGIASAAVSLSSIFIPAEKINVTADKYDTVSGQIFTLTWGAAEDAGSYTLSYPCQTGVHLEAISGSGANVASEVIFCNTPFHFINQNNSLTLAAYTNTSAAVEIPISLFFRENGATRDTSNTTVTVRVSGGSATPNPPTTNPPATQPPVTPKPPTTNPPKVTGPETVHVYPIVLGTTTPANNPQGAIDLTGRIIRTGVIATSTNTFIAKDKVRPNERAAVQFEVVNNGTRTSRDWSFAVVLPTFPSYIFQSESQQPLAPGDKIQYTLGFDKIKQQAENEIRLNIDNTGINNEQNKANNIVTGKIYVELIY